MGCFKSKKSRGQVVGRREQEEKVVEGRAENADGGSQMEEEDGVGSEARRRGGRRVDDDTGSIEAGEAQHDSSVSGSNGASDSTNDVSPAALAVGTSLSPGGRATFVADQGRDNENAGATRLRLERNR